MIIKPFINLFNKHLLNTESAGSRPPMLGAPILLSFRNHWAKAQASSSVGRDGVESTVDNPSLWFFTF